ncbi:MAG: pyridoxamine 5'-phosphate oxidase family protein [Campylobacteraceae bacterium]|nr:pyridoxamine 5'-phosphate oxidase family protein [Campylobacteraceae bacterium]
MKKNVTITDQKLIQDILDDTEYGTLALCANNKPYSIPINFVEVEGEIYFHGSKKGKKMNLIKENAQASFSVVESFSLTLLPSYFSTGDGNGAPSTQLFKSVIIDGKIEVIEDYDEKANALEFLLQKLQKEGKYTPLTNEMYKKIINAVGVYKLIPDEITGKCYFGQGFNQKRYDRVSEHLKERGTPKDLATLELMKEYRK